MAVLLGLTRMGEPPSTAPDMLMARAAATTSENSMKANRRKLCMSQQMRHSVMVPHTAKAPRSSASLTVRLRAPM